MQAAHIITRQGIASKTLMQIDTMISLVLTARAFILVSGYGSRLFGMESAYELDKDHDRAIPIGCDVLGLDSRMGNRGRNRNLSC